MRTTFPRGEGIFIEINSRLSYEIHSLQFFPQEKATYEYPGCPAEVELSQVIIHRDDHTMNMSSEGIRAFENLYQSEIMAKVLERRAELYDEVRVERGLLSEDDWRE